MDIISHGLYGGIAFGRVSRISYWKAFFFGVAPDLGSFGIPFATSLLSLASGPDFHSGPPDPATIPSYVHVLYNITHSLIIALVVFGLVWLVRTKPLIELLAWPLHIAVDIPTHSSAFFPTPFLWPLSDYTVNGIGWGQPIIFIPNVIILALLYTGFYLRKRRKICDTTLS